MKYRRDYRINFAVNPFFFVCDTQKKKKNELYDCDKTCIFLIFFLFSVSLCELPFVENGRFLHNESVAAPGQYVVVECSQGFHINGSSDIVLELLCDANGVLMSLPICESKSSYFYYYS